MRNPHIGPELPQVLFEVLFWALFLVKALFWTLEVLILLLEPYFAPFVALFCGLYLLF